MVKQVDEESKPTNDQIVNLLDYLYSKFGEVNRVFDIVKFADNMIFDHTGFPIAHCGAGINALSINPNGDVYPCVKINDPKKQITNILKDDAIREINESRRSIINNDFIFNKKQCEDCKIKYYCGGGCRAEEKEGQICEYNFQYFNLAVSYYLQKLVEGVNHAK